MAGVIIHCETLWFSMEKCHIKIVMNFATYKFQVIVFYFHCRESHDDAFVSQFSDLLLQRLFEAAIQAAGDHDKVKSNAVRALGMLVRFIQPHTLGKSSHLLCIHGCLYLCPIIEQSLEVCTAWISSKVELTHFRTSFNKKVYFMRWR